MKNRKQVKQDGMELLAFIINNGGGIKHAQLRRWSMMVREAAGIDDSDIENLIFGTAEPVSARGQG